MTERLIASTNATNNNNMLKGSGICEKIGITMPKDLVEQIDRERQLVPRSTYISKAMAQHLKRKTGKT